MRNLLQSVQKTRFHLSKGLKTFLCYHTYLIPEILKLSKHKEILGFTMYKGQIDSQTLGVIVKDDRYNYDFLCKLDDLIYNRNCYKCSFIDTNKIHHFSTTLKLSQLHNVEYY